ncbi:MAG: fructose-bisphosphatase class II [Candidatus Kerfeldbacteria bacterium CG15_BIG_FIL_POST_REV_8_21_14_020_45_12]|uniref:Fructose-1,6-bisphosphatase n=1 Tax=Candidatus Kerfeldbacteria bacterium CG15_BIG_FIL_POST_REV_8_21_14_020_45_12 TaxID=2014247 RepID=A0A2M7H3P0_9BACT|nr:MAG: fructose-bisphosphatase class II [Candidatus Kerfeldbacteria bacterium CG15_BIG_FIL_POST_REV_8_21_14_020_45_12]PJA93462.1 MAG: fructose-bisphosphatase class II [Candidatus Kerfeldbacteria bacterium CG_4_9_14_3_um_filter_45_8]
MHKLLELDLVRVVEDAAIASAKLMGAGDNNSADQAATEAMRLRLNDLNIDGRIVIGEGERDEAPMLYIGEEVGTKAAGAPQIDIAVDPLEGTNLCSSGGNGSVTLMAIAERGGLLHAPDIYMNKLIVSPEAAGKVDINAPVKDNIASLAKALGRTAAELVVVVLERDRHDQLIKEIRATGARIKLVTDGDVMPSIAAAVHGPNIHAVMGVGAAPEGVITAAALKCLKGYMQAHFVIRNDEDERRLKAAGVKDPSALLEIDDLAPGKQILFAATGVTSGELLEPVRFFAGGARTNTLVMSLSEGTARFVDSIHSLDGARLPVIFR